MATSDLLTTEQAADRLGVTARTLRNWVDARRIRHIVLPSGQFRFRPEDLAEVLEPVEPTEAAS